MGLAAASTLLGADGGGGAGRLGLLVARSQHLYAEYKSNRSTIEAQFSAAGSVQSKPFHPNTEVQAAQSEQIAEQQKTVFELWKQLYDRQTAEVLKWPSNLSDDFRKYIEKLKFGDNIPPELRSQYNNYILDHFPNLPKIVGALEAPEGQAGGMGRGGAGGFNVQSFLDSHARRCGRNGTWWPATRRGAGLHRRFGPTSRRSATSCTPRPTPSSKRIWKTQEDLWVYERC